MKKLFLINLLIVIMCSSFAGIVPYEQAKQVAKSHYYMANRETKSLNWDNLELVQAIDPTTNPNFKFYVFNVGNDDGYVVVSSNDLIQPILAYSNEGSFNENNMAPSQKFFYEYYNECIEYAKLCSESSQSLKSSDSWQMLLSFNPKNSNCTKDDVITSPILLEGIKWDQNWPYNSACPTASGTPTGYNGHVPVGCVATAMLQAMKYWNWPPTGTGSKTHNRLGTHTVNFAQQNYDWGAMPDKATLATDEIGKINYHAGVAVSMGWTATGSGASTSSIVTALKNYFKYSSTVREINKAGQTDASWKNTIFTEIDAKRPIVYSGSPVSGSAGHAWNCDGYEKRAYGDYFHMNWGWGGSGNSYCSLDTLISPATPGGPEWNFIRYNSIIVGIQPNAEFRAGCQGTYITRGVEGSFKDGSIGNYDNNLNCTYIIQPNCGQIINLTFSKFDLASGDKVQIYEGGENSERLLATYDMNNRPNVTDNTPTTTNGLMSKLGAFKIKFITDGSQNADGWKVSYKSAYCYNEPPLIFTAQQGSLDDGSGSCLYRENTSCTWKILPTVETENIYIRFNDFQVAFRESTDRLIIYNSETLIPANRVFAFNSADAVPPINEMLVVPGNIAVVRFTSGQASTGEGWSLNYYTDNTVNINEIHSNNSINVFPNPNSGNFNIKGIENADITIINIVGELIYKQNNVTESTNINLSNLTNGIYFVKIIDKNNIYNKKIVIEK